MAALSQDPVYGELTELRGKTKAYVSADPMDREKIIETITKNKLITVVDDPAAAEFFIQYRTTQQNQGPLGLNFATGQLEIYLKSGDQKRIVWAKSNTNGAFKAAVAGALAKKFAKDFSRLEKR